MCTLLATTAYFSESSAYSGARCLNQAQVKKHQPDIPSDRKHRSASKKHGRQAEQRSAQHSTAQHSTAQHSTAYGVCRLVHGAQKWVKNDVEVAALARRRPGREELEHEVLVVLGPHVLLGLQVRGRREWEQAGGADTFIAGLVTSRG